MKIYELFEVSGNPKRNDLHYSEYRIYNNSLYLEAECLVDCNEDLNDDITEEEFNKLVEKELDKIIYTLKKYGRYPVNGIPKYVAY